MHPALRKALGLRSGPNPLLLLRRGWVRRDPPLRHPRVKRTPWSTPPSPGPIGESAPPLPSRPRPSGHKPHGQTDESSQGVVDQCQGMRSQRWGPGFFFNLGTPPSPRVGLKLLFCPGRHEGFGYGQKRIENRKMTESEFLLGAQTARGRRARGWEVERDHTVWVVLLPVGLCFRCRAHPAVAQRCDARRMPKHNCRVDKS